MSQQKACVIFNKLIVNNIENSSGIFIGTNQALGWSTYGKTNHGFGSLSSSTLTNSVNVVYDSDAIDASVEDARDITLVEAANALQQSAIDFQSINANALNSGAAIDLGHNKQLGWRNSRKVNYGTGKSLGSNYLKQIANLVLDNDVIDAPQHTEEKVTDETEGIEKNTHIVQKKPAAPDDKTSS
ncbi:hypothetical protein ACE3NQ_22775 [Paenibacillus terreus]|uniref:Uncharacterized protein n=1 Tax=Paenibacillus terreus TaxID=1387834 RepID=A0ABV5BDV2_9BACL